MIDADGYIRLLRGDELVSDPKWPDEPFKAKHESGTPVTVTPVASGEPDLLPQSMRVGREPAQELHWADLEHQRLTDLRNRLFLEGVGAKGHTTNLTMDMIYALLVRLERAEARIAHLEHPKPPEGT